MQNKKLTSLLFRLWKHLPSRRHKQFGLLMILIVFASIAEVVSIGSIIPFLGILTAPEEILRIEIVNSIARYFNIQSASDFLFPLTAIFVCAVLVAGATRLLLLWVSTRLSYATGADLSIGVYYKTLYQPYITHIKRNSSEVISGILGKANGLVAYAILPVVNIISGLIILVSILSTLIFFDPVVSVSAVLGMGIIYAIIGFFTRERLAANGKVLSEEYSKVVKTLQEGLGGIRDVLIDGNQDAYCDLYKISEQKLRKAYADNNFTSYSPRFLMEALGMVLIALFAYFLFHSEKGISTALPFLGSMALGAQRLLPIVQLGYQSWTSLKTSESLLVDVLEFLDQELPAYAAQPKPSALPFTSSISIKDVYFRYSENAPMALKNLNLEILKGQRIGIIGQTGSGKSTFLDLFMALLEPTEGSIFVDGTIVDSKTARAWQANIAHVPQSIFLADSSVAENIALGVPLELIDMGKVKFAAKQAQISDHIESLKEGYHSFVGERGVRLSGGQRQRIGIARALYKEASVIVFDEATSALDSETEKAVMDSIHTLGKDLTILMIAHRLTTVQNCDMIIELKDGEIQRKGTFTELFKYSSAI
ncbi:ABC transporter ATP-binding protein [Leptospira kmetyi]|uniref:Multidrug resistance-like ATP-binding protein MdlB n=1 Tax=Leptospira kmetyi TaxID=408139 RepID=A0A5F1XZC6_9LEPT|nr:ABC transporter ATP-binding protein [Leptospira kmetyi]AYV57207.1 ABC transporter ATP-binding protein [Leptospira kmetyi]TGK21430.1 ABC transporter ATP-binding protein [Leptospira kmetyi]TGK28357.1 ABC transporter ATP-binding protein [Leptospira kmetyi]TGL68276.1 ABC transporter ATP-binding protein [Leptospira kmetyi]